MLTGTLGRTTARSACSARIRCGSAARRVGGSPTCRSCSASTRTSRRRRTSASSPPCTASVPSAAARLIRRALEVVELYRRAASARARSVRWHAAPPRAGLRARPQPGRAVRRRADGRDRSDAAREDLGRAAQRCATRDARCSSPRSTSPRRSTATASRSSPMASWLPRRTRRAAQAGVRGRRARGHDGSGPSTPTCSPACRASPRYDSRPPRQLFVTTEDAASTTPQIIEMLREAGIAVVGMEEHQPTFDEVFTASRRATALARR